MREIGLVAGSLVLAGCAMPPAGNAPSEPVSRPEVRLEVREDQRRVDVLVAGRPFTAYVWPQELKKPVLHPIRSAAGVIVTRGFPPGAGERADHPHHVGLWLSYGDVNGFDFWNNSEAIPAERAGRMGTIHHKRIVRAESGTGRAELAVESEWVTGAGDAVLAETTRFVFQAAPDARSIDRFTELRTTAGRVALEDHKEGLLGLRVVRALEDPGERSGLFVGPDGSAVEVEEADSAGVTGRYLSSEGLSGGAVWGTRGRWTLLGGSVGGRPVTLAILDHPDNPGFPTYWHARGYGLFSANPLGQAVFSEGQHRLGLAVDAGSVRFRHRIVILDEAASAAGLERRYSDWVAVGDPAAAPAGSGPPQR